MAPSTGAIPENGHGEHTGKVLLMAKDAMHGEIQTVKRIQFWASLAVTIAGAGFAAAMFMNRYATAGDLEKLSDKQDATQQTLQQHVVSETAQISSLRQSSERSHEDFEYVRDQVYEISRATRGVRLLPRPVHPAMKPTEAP